MERNYTYEEMEEVRRQAEIQERKAIVLEGQIQMAVKMKAWKRQRRIELAMVPVRIVIFPVMLLVKLFRWTYNYED